jgi:hypothetical protein
MSNNTGNRYYQAHDQWGRPYNSQQQGQNAYGQPQAQSAYPSQSSQVARPQTGKHSKGKKRSSENLKSSDMPRIRMEWDESTENPNPYQSSKRSLPKLNTKSVAAGQGQQYSANSATKGIKSAAGAVGTCYDYPTPQQGTAAYEQYYRDYYANQNNTGSGR